MRRSFVVAIGAALALSAAPAGSSPRAEDAQLLVGGATPLTSGFFFPGTGIHDGTDYQYPAPLQVTQGTDIVLTNLDESTVANNHQVRSLKLRTVWVKVKGKKKKVKKKRPLFASKPVYHPGDSVTIKVSGLKPGLYKYKCTTHAGMFGAFEIVKE